MADAVEHPDHYSGNGSVECMDAVSDWSVGSTPLGELYASGAGWGEVGGPSHRHGWARVEERGRTYAVAEDDCRVRHLLCRGASNTREAFAAFRAWADANPRDGATG